MYIMMETLLLWIHSWELVAAGPEVVKPPGHC